MRTLDFDTIAHVYILSGYTDLCKSIDGLCRLIDLPMRLDCFPHKKIVIKANKEEKTCWC